MRESFTYGSVGRALRKQCLYPEADGEKIAVFRKGPAILEFIRAAAHRRRSLPENLKNLPVDKVHIFVYPSERGRAKLNA